MFYVKKMQYAEWANYQNDFETLFMDLKAPRDMALLVWTEAGGEHDRIAITDENFEAAQALSPDEWEEVEKLEEGWAFLVGHAEAFERLSAAFSPSQEHPSD